MKRAPAVFFSHGSPLTALDRGEYAQALSQFGNRCASARGVLILSAHWETPRSVRVTSWLSAPLLYDFSGFPPQLSRIRYPAPGHPDLAEEAAQRLRERGFDVAFELQRGLDHGAWVPLVLALPDAQVPVVQISLPHGAPPEQVFALGAALRPLRDSGILLAGSGGIVHNLSLAFANPFDAPPEKWAIEFDAWVAARIESRLFPALLEYTVEAPYAALAVPTTEHFTPLFFTLGATHPNDSISTLFRGMEHGNISMASYAFGL